MMGSDEKTPEWMADVEDWGDDIVVGLLPDETFGRFIGAEDPAPLFGHLVSEQTGQPIGVAAHVVGRVMPAEGHTAELKGWGPKQRMLLGLPFQMLQAWLMILLEFWMKECPEDVRRHPNISKSLRALVDELEGWDLLTDPDLWEDEEGEDE
jgi:hypothetical protein